MGSVGPCGSQIGFFESTSVVCLSEQMFVRTFGLGFFGLAIVIGQDQDLSSKVRRVIMLGLTFRENMNLLKTIAL